jgi:HEPN domain-containing protein
MRGDTLSLVYWINYRILGGATKALIDAGKELDKHYIPPRYPNSYPEGAPFEYYTKSEAERAVAHTTDILDFCKSVLAESG